MGSIVLTAPPKKSNQPPTAAPVTVTTTEDQPVTGAVAATDPDGDRLRFTLARKPKRGVVTLSGDGAFVYTPRPDAHGDDAFSVTVNDGRARAACEVTVRVTPLNDAPRVAPLTLSTTEDVAVAGALEARDVDGDALTFSVRAPPAHGRADVDARGRLTYAPASDFSGADELSVVVSDGTASAEARVQVRVAAVNDPPVLRAAALSVAEDAAGEVTLEASDVDGDRLQYAIVTAPRHGAATLDGARLRYVPARDFAGADTIVVRVSDGAVERQGTVAVTVTAVNDAPVPSPLALSTSEDVSVSGALRATDVDGDTLRFTVTAPPAHGAARVDASGTLTYTPQQDFHGPDTCAVTVTDGVVSVPVAVTVSVAPVNDAPALSAGPLVTNEDTSGSLRLTASDADGDALRYSVSQPPAHGSATVDEAGQSTYTPAADFAGDDAYTVSVTDGKATTSARVPVSVRPVNDAPVTKPLRLSGAEDSALSGAASATDVERGALTWSVARAPAHGEARVERMTGAVTYTPKPDFHGEDAFALSVSDGQLSTALEVSVTVTAVNDAPRAKPLQLTTREDTAGAGQLEASDADGDAVTWTLSRPPARGTATVDAKSGAVTYTPKPDLNGADGFSVTVSDGTASASAEVSVAVAPVNDAPVVSKPLSLSGPEDSALRGALTASDVDLDPLTWSLDKPPAHGTATIDARTGAVAYQPAPDFNGQDRFDVSVRDGTVSVGTTVDVVVSAVNDAPTVAAARLTTAEDTAGELRLEARDADGDALTFRLAEAPARGTATLDATTGLLRYTPAKDFHGTDGCAVSVTDGDATVTARVAITVESRNDAPEVAGLSLSTVEDKAVDGALKASDVDGDRLTFTVSTAPAHGQASVDARGAVSYRPERDFNGPDRFAVTVSDGALSVTADVSVTVAALDDPPVAVASALSLDEDTPGTGALEASDPDGDALTYRVVSRPAHGRLTVDEKSGAFTYTPAPDFHGADAFTFDVSDGELRSAERKVALEVRAVNDAPRARGVALTLAEDGVGQGSVTASDVDGDPLTFSIDEQPQRGTASVVAKTGAFTYRPARDFFGADRFVVAVSDRGASAKAEVTVTVTPVADPPQARVGAVETPEDTPLEGTLAGSDPDGDRLRFTLTSTPRLGKAELLDATTGAWRYTPTANATGDDELRFEVSDGATSAKGVMQVRVTPVNDAPTVTSVEFDAVEDQPREGRFTGEDVDGDALTWAITPPPSGTLTVDAAQGTFRFVPAKDTTGDVRFTVQASDGKASSAATPVVLHVAPVNDAPVAQASKLDAEEDAPARGKLVATDIDGDELTYSLVRAPAHGTVTIINPKTGEYGYLGRDDYNGADSFTFAATDPAGLSSTALVTVAVASVDDAPIAISETLSAPRRGSITGRLHGLDRDGKRVVFAIVDKPAAGKVVLLDANTGDFSFSCEGTNLNELVFRFTVSDGKLTSEPADFTLKLRSF